MSSKSPLIFIGNIIYKAINKYGPFSIIVNNKQNKVTYLYFLC